MFSDVDGPCDSQAPRQVCAPRNALPETTLYVPLQFWFCTNPGLALPLIALQYHEVKINLDIRPTDDCLWAVTTLSCNSGGAPMGTTAATQATYVGNQYAPIREEDTHDRRATLLNLTDKGRELVQQGIEDTLSLDGSTGGEIDR